VRARSSAALAVLILLLLVLVLALTAAALVLTLLVLTLLVLALLALLLTPTVLSLLAVLFLIVGHGDVSSKDCWLMPVPINRRRCAMFPAEAPNCPQRRNTARLFLLFFQFLA